MYHRVYCSYTYSKHVSILSTNIVSIQYTVYCYTYITCKFTDVYLCNAVHVCCILYVCLGSSLFSSCLKVAVFCIVASALQHKAQQIGLVSCTNFVVEFPSLVCTACILSIASSIRAFGRLQFSISEVPAFQF